ncbi:perlwapin-like protein [Ostrea edulis]|uniref:perlwapin-like protein n=1 Tax=Ostrea edulis TaxID=37623 RepID=UPI0024AEB2E1|nr:perlwapin-like protein [Ostrea edulis]
MLGKVIVLFFVASACAQLDKKPGSCPKPGIITTCECDPWDMHVGCSGDDECPGDEKCCSYGCGCRVGCVAPEKKRVCKYNGKVYKSGHSFPSTDGCNTCTCRFDGLVTCTYMICNQRLPRRRSFDFLG